MKATHCTKEDLKKALKKVNKKYKGNIKFNPDSDLPSRFILRVNGKGPGSAFSPAYVMGLDWAKKRRTGSACWHAYGDFFDALFEVNPNAVIWSRGNKITKSSGNWQDWNAGNAYLPAYASNCCECDGEI